MDASEETYPTTRLERPGVMTVGWALRFALSSSRSVGIDSWRIISPGRFAAAASALGSDERRPLPPALPRGGGGCALSLGRRRPPPAPPISEVRRPCPTDSPSRPSPRTASTSVNGCE
jgi:hypothetical protein